MAIQNSEIKGEIKGKIEELKKSILSLLSIRFSPALAAQARPAVMAVQAYETLELLFNLVAVFMAWHRC